jgi:cell division protein FtsB
MKITRILYILLGLVALALFIRLWIGTGSYPEIWDLEARIAEQTRQNAEQAKRNEHLQADVVDIGRDDATIEDHARGELGMIKNGETFYQVIMGNDATAMQPQPPVAPAPTAPVAPKVE